MRRSNISKTRLAWLATLAAAVLFAPDLQAGLPAEDWPAPRPLDEPLVEVPAEGALAQLAATEGLGFLLVSSDTCPSCPEQLAMFTSVAGPLADLGPIVQVEILDIPEAFRRTYGIRGSPNLLVYRDGLPVDFIPMSPFFPEEWLRHVFARLEPGAREPYYMSDLTEMPRERRTWPDRAGLTHIAHNWGDVLAPDLDLRSSVFSGLGLRGADFSRTDFTGPLFAACDLTGARFDGANLEGVVWLSVLCPDGVRSEDAGNSCVEHLTP